jgi:hypothetical protein
MAAPTKKSSEDRHVQTVLAAFAKIFQSASFMAHMLGDHRLHTIAASRCY